MENKKKHSRLPMQVLLFFLFDNGNREITEIPREVDQEQTIIATRRI